MPHHPRTNPRFRLPQWRVNDFFKRVKEGLRPPPPYKVVQSEKKGVVSPRFKNRFLAKHTTQKGLDLMYEKSKKKQQKEEKLALLNAKRALVFDTPPVEETQVEHQEENQEDTTSLSEDEIIPPTPPNTPFSNFVHFQPLNSPSPISCHSTTPPPAPVLEPTSSTNSDLPMYKADFTWDFDELHSMWGELCVCVCVYVCVCVCVFLPSLVI